MRYLLALTFLLISCGQIEDESASEITVPSLLSDSSYAEIYQDKVLGLLVGSAMGDAMGASTEMWPRDQRRAEYGFIDRLTAPELSPSAEGVWDTGYPAGATTDDTRWKMLAGSFVKTLGMSWYQNDDLVAKKFARFIIHRHQQLLQERENKASADSSDRQLYKRQEQWLVEWAEVSKAFSSGKISTYNTALSRFYGGDLLCAGLLYMPVFAIPYPGEPERAYRQSFELALFDQGFARDLSALSAAMTAQAFHPQATEDSLFSIFNKVDPHGFSERRIFPRAAGQILATAQKHAITIKQSGLQVEERIDLARNLLTPHHETVSPHAREILLLTLTAMISGDLDFQKTIEFLVNYGRDSDTTAALAGAILGAYHGFDQLPEYKHQVMQVNLETHTFDLKQLAHDISQTFDL